MPLGTNAFWGVILPQEATNIITNPSFERGTAGWGTLQAGTIGTTSSFQAFGAWAGSIAPTSNGTAGAVSPTYTSGAGTTYYFSAYVYGANGIPYRLAVGDSNGANFVGSTTFTGGGTWQRYVGSYTEAGGATRRVVLTKNSSADTSAFYIDGVQVESSAYTTYIDGDQDSGTWQGAVHNSPSFRSGQNRTGGSVAALADLFGLQPDLYPGAGMPPIQNSFQSYAIIDGAQYQRTRAVERTFTLEFKPIAGASLQDLHTTRRNIINALKIDRVTPQQPTRLWYTGAGGTVQIDAVLDGGLELNESMTTVTEEVNIKFLAVDPYWYSTTQQGTALAAYTNIGSTNWIAKRNAQGQWGTIGVNGTTTNTRIQRLAMSPGGTLFLGGDFTQVGGTNYNLLAMYYPTTNTFGTLLGGTVNSNGVIQAMAFNAGGTLYFGGQIASVGGTSANFLAKYANNAYGTLLGGTVNQIVYDATWRGGTFIAGGVFTTAGGTAAPGVAMHVNDKWGTFTNGTVGLASGQVSAVEVALDSSIYVSGTFSTAGGTTVNGIARWNGSWGSVGGGLISGVGAPANLGAYTLLAAPDGKIYAGGQIGTAGNTVVRDAAVYNGVGWSAMGSGLADSANAPTYNVYRMVYDPVTTFIVAAGSFADAGGIPSPNSLAYWNGYTWLPSDFTMPGQGITIRDIALGFDRTLYIAGTFSGTAQVASVGTIVNLGMAAAYPTMTMYNNSATGTARLYQLCNTTTGAGLYFNVILEPGETAKLTLTPGARSFVSDFRGNLLGNILPGSNLATFNLLPGTNYLSFFADNTTVQTSIAWAPRHHSLDAGTVF